MLYTPKVSIAMGSKGYYFTYYYYYYYYYTTSVVKYLNTQVFKHYLNTTTGI